MKSVLSRVVIDLFFISLTLVAGYLLIGFYFDSSYLATGYPDWIYHAFRVKSLAENGLLSWDTVWVNGLNHWSGYPFGVHYLVLLLSSILPLDITQTMMILTIAVFLALRVLTYVFLRLLQIKPFYAFFAVMISYSFGHQWNAISDFGLFIVMLWIPLYVFLWAKSSENTRYFFVTAAITGYLWSVHPVLGYSLSAMLFVLILLRRSILSKGRQFGLLVLYLLGSAFFIYSQFFAGYSFSNPVVSLSQYWKTTVVSPYYGLSLLYLILLLLGWGIILLRADFVPRWAKILHLFATVYLIFIWVVLDGYAPGFIGKLQISRAITVIGFILPFSFAALVQGAFRGTASRFVPGVLVAVIAISLTNGIELGSQYSGQPVSVMENPVARYFGNQVPAGSIYTDDVSAASYFGNSHLRYVNSYNEHRDPHPLGQRFKNLMRTDSAYTGVTQRQIELVNAYSRVLGVEYIFLPELSPLVRALTISQSDSSQFILESTVSTDQGVFAILRATYPIAYAYSGDEAYLRSAISFTNLQQPDLYADSYKQWDDQILGFYELIRTGEVTPIDVTFPQKEQIALDLRDNRVENPAVILVQSYDSNWRSATPVKIEATSLRFMYLSTVGSIMPDRLYLSHSWPTIYWALQIVGAVAILIAFVVGIFSKDSRREVL